VSVDDIAAKIGEQLSAALDKAHEELAQKKLVLHVEGVRDETQRNGIREQAGKLIDAGGSNSILSKGGFGDCYYLEVSPVADVEVVAGKIKFGSIVAVDAEQRTIVVDASQPSGERPEAGWPGKEQFDLFLKRQAIEWVSQQANEDKLKKLGREKIVIVAWFATSDEPDWAATLDKQLDKLPGTLNPTTTYETYGPNFQNVAIATIESDLSMSDIAQMIGGPDCWIDEMRRVLVLSPPKRP